MKEKFFVIIKNLITEMWVGKKVCIIIFFIYFINTFLYPSTASFMDINCSPEIISKGNAGIAYPKGIENFQLNPACCINFNERNNIDIFFAHKNYILDTKLDYLALSILFPKYYALAISSKIFYDVSEGERITTKDGAYTGERFKIPFNLCITFGIAKVNKEWNLYTGGRLKIIYQKFKEYTSSGYAIDAGIIAKLFDINGVLLGLAIKNFGASSGYIEESDLYPLRINAGFYYNFIHLKKLRNKLILVIDIDINCADNVKKIKSGIGYKILKWIEISCGYDYEIGRKDIIDGLKAGIVVERGRYRIGYGIEYLGDIGYLHSVGIKVRLYKSNKR